MKRLLLLTAIALGFVVPVHSQSNEPLIRLVGIISLPGFQNAMFEEQPSAWRSRMSPPRSYYSLKTGQSMRSIKVISIDAEKGTVEARTTTNQTFSLTELPSTPPHPAIQLQSVPLYDVFELYSTLAERTLLCAPNLPNTHITLRAAATDRAEAAQLLASVIKSNHIQLVPDGKKFVQVVAEGMETNPHSDKIKSAPPKTNETIHEGEIDFRSVPIGQFLDVYEKFIGRQLTDRNTQPLPASTISLTSRNPLSQAEAIYAFDTLLAFQNIKVVPVGTNEAKIEWISPPVNSK